MAHLSGSPAVISRRWVIFRKETTTSQVTGARKTEPEDLGWDPLSLSGEGEEAQRGHRPLEAAQPPGQALPSAHMSLPLQAAEKTR